MKRISVFLTALFIVISNVTLISGPAGARHFESPVTTETHSTQGCARKCPNRPLGDEPYTYQISGDRTVYSWPAIRSGNGWAIRQSAVTFSNKLFSLPFTDRDVTDATGWLYEAGDWHYAIDYSNEGVNKSFEVHPAADGRVIFVGWDDWSGNTIVISHEADGADSFRTIYMHLRNGPVNDCNKAWAESMPLLRDDSGNLKKYRAHLNASGCPRDEGGRQLKPLHWGTENQKIRVQKGDRVTTQQVIAFAGDTGPGGQVAAGDPNAPNTHLHIFFARLDPTDNVWYFFDPYGIYGASACYPKGITDPVERGCARFSIAWRNDRPQRP